MEYDDGASGPPVTDTGPLATGFAAEFRRALASIPEGSPWNGTSERTRVLKGSGGARAGSVLHRTFEALGYCYKGHHENQRVFDYEWNDKDMVAIDGLGADWAAACYRGRYRYDVVCEVENNLAEVALTMRGMFDLRARLSVAMFFADTSDPLFGESLWNRRKSKELRPLSSWAPPTGGTEDFPWRFAEGDEVLIMLLATQRPEVLAVRGWTMRDGAWR